ncbi:hypothetical protein [Paludibacterium yongneupense]|uniref:hypothetical protein n=1 Tax=Paludibacterium yongneupense TaxID=400061 RepID=UPI0003FC261B|nr:hypothetical protein [Paludibacterium yongneupense]
MKKLTLLAAAALGLSSLTMAADNQDQFESNNNWHIQNHVVVGQAVDATVKTAAPAAQATENVGAGGQDLFEQNSNGRHQNNSR